jgi:hypothetical protein
MPVEIDRMPDKRRLLVTLAKEPFQPVRLYYSIPGQAFVTGKLRALQCVVEVPAEHSWQWLYCAESTSHPFPKNYARLARPDPVVLGRIRFPERDRMTFQTNSTARAIEGGRFFAARLGAEVAPMRCRVVNRCFAEGEGSQEDLMATLDRDVTVVDPREAEATLRREFAHLRSAKDPERATADGYERMLKLFKDVPTVEDFPLYPDEETPDLVHLSNALSFRMIRAVEHWRGNTHMTMAELIARAVGAK